MREQYHFRPSKNGFYAWDVDVLVALTKNLPVKTVALGTIKEFDENWWYQNSDDIPTCRSVTEHFKLVNATDLSYPVILSSDGRLMDGMHRICKAHLEGRDIIKAVQFEDDPEPTYVDVTDVDALPY